MYPLGGAKVTKRLITLTVEDNIIIIIIVYTCVIFIYCLFFIRAPVRPTTGDYAAMLSP